MATFTGTKRAVYTKDKVKKLRAARKTKKPTTSTIIDDVAYQSMLGELKGAGHLSFQQFRKWEADIHRQSPLGINAKPKVSKTITISYDVLVEEGDKPHLSGYIQSAADVDGKPYRVKGWINEDGSLRLEIVK
jgi:hypothetical protein